MKKSIIVLMFLIPVLWVKAQKTTHGDCRTSISATYSHNFYSVGITNYTQECMNYKIKFPDGYIVSPNRAINGGTTQFFNYTAPFVHGSVVVIPATQAPATCPSGSVQVNL